MWLNLATVSLGGTTISVPAYGTFLVLAALTSLALAAGGAARLGVSGRAAVAGYSLAIAAGIVGARLLDVVLDWGPYAQDPGRIVALELRGFALAGGLAAGLVVTNLAARRWRLSMWSLADSAIPAVAAGIVLIRVGCFLSGCCSGSPTDLPWGVVFPPTGLDLDTQILAGAGLLHVSDAALAVHPTQLYELVAALGCAAIALWLRRRVVAPGVPALAFAATFLVFRAGNQFLRLPPPGATFPDLLPLAYLLAGLAVAALLWWRSWQMTAMRRGVGTVPASV